MRRRSQHVVKGCPWLHEGVIDESHLGNLRLFEKLRYEAPLLEYVALAVEAVLVEVLVTTPATLRLVRLAIVA